MKALKIKVNTVKRNIKDLQFARAEVITECKRLEDMKVANSDKVSQQELVVNQARMMLPHCENRLRSAMKDLQNYLDNNSKNISTTSAVDEQEMSNHIAAVMEEAEATLDKV